MIPVVQKIILTAMLSFPKIIAAHAIILQIEIAIFGTDLKDFTLGFLGVQGIETVGASMICTRSNSEPWQNDSKLEGEKGEDAPSCAREHLHTRLQTAALREPGK